MQRISRRGVSVIIILSGSLAATSGLAVGDTVTEWNEIMLDAIRIGATAPPAASRGMAMVHTAVFDAVNAVTQQYNAYHVETTAPAGTSAEAAAASAAPDVLLHLYPGQAATFDTELTNSLTTVPDGPDKTNGVTLGQYVAGQIIDWRSADGSTSTGDYTVTDGVGQWRPTLPGYAPPLVPQWGYVTPFGIASPSQFRPAGPPLLTSAQYAAEHDEVRVLGTLNSTTRTADQTEIAYFWADGAGTATPPGHWNAITQTISEMKGYTLAENARLFALLNVALADAGIAAWDAKYEYDLWRAI